MSFSLELLQKGYDIQKASLACGYESSSRFSYRFKQIFGFPVTAGGLLTSGTSNSTHLAIQVAMFRKLGLDYKNKGFFGVSQPLRCYTSKEGHSSIIKAIQTCGIGSDNLIVVDTNDDHQDLQDILCPFALKDL